MSILGGMGRESDCKQAGASKEMVLGDWAGAAGNPY